MSDRPIPTQEYDLNLWNDDTISAADWLHILELELMLDDAKPSANDVLDWLIQKGLVLEGATGKSVARETYLSHVTRMKKNYGASSSEGSYYQTNMVGVIARHISFRSCLCYFEDLAYRAMKFFMPRGEVDSTSEFRPLGLYQATRHSIAFKNRIIRSAFLFYENEREEERLYPYEHYRNSKILRFKEVRLIKNETGEDYKIFSGGLVFQYRRSFIAIGTAYQVFVEKEEKLLKFSDIKDAKTVYYVFDDDNDSEIVRGVKSTILKNEGRPVTPVIELRRVETETKINWDDIINSSHIEIGTVDIPFTNRPDLADILPRLQSEHHPDYMMDRIRRFQ